MLYARIFSRVQGLDCTAPAGLKAGAGEVSALMYPSLRFANISHRLIRSTYWYTGLMACALSAMPACPARSVTGNAMSNNQDGPEPSLSRKPCV
jgi:hypothetical protein